jgi:hypothetical protein
LFTVEQERQLSTREDDQFRTEIRESGEGISSSAVVESDDNQTNWSIIHRLKTCKADQNTGHDKNPSPPPAATASLATQSRESCWHTLGFSSCESQIFFELQRHTSRAIC